MSTDKAASKTAKSKARASGSTSFSRPSIASSRALSASDSEDPFASDPELGSEPEVVDVDMEKPGEEERTERIPEALLTRLMHEFFKEDNTRIGKDTGAAVQKYMETFVIEAMTRAYFAGVEKDSGGDGFLEVEDLEKLAPQILLDF
jgi:centromere protein X